MKKSTLPVLLFLISLVSYGQNVKQLLQHSYSKCRNIKSGYYEMEKKMKFMSLKDTTLDLQFKFYFKKLKNDSLYTVAFNSEMLHQGDYIRNDLYTGNEYITFCKMDSSAKIMSKAKWAKTIKERSRNDIFNFYLPFTSEDCTPLPKASDYNDKRHIFRFIAKERQNNMLSYHVQMIEYPKYDSTDMMHFIQTVYDYWINSKDMLPIKYSASSKILNSGDTLSEYSSYSLKKYNLNNQQSKNSMPLQLSSIPAFCNVKDYVEIKNVELLSKDANAPMWALNSLEGKSVSLTDYKGKIVLIDFFYKDCYPCMKALPILQSFNEKYKRKGLAVVGIDPIDEENGGIKKFILKRGITYKILLDEKKDAAIKYNVSGYPTIYLIDKNGKIIYSNSGFDEALESKLEELIKSNL